MAATSQQTMLNQALFEQHEQQDVASLSTTQMMSGAINCNISTLNPNLITAFPLLGGNYQSLFKGFMPSPPPPPQPSVEAPPPLPPHNNLAAETFLLLSSKQREEENNDINVNQDYILAGSNLLSLQRSGANLWAWGDHQGNHSERSNTRRNMNDEINCNNNNNNNNHHHHHHLHHHRQVLGVGTMKMKKIIKGRKKVREPRFCFKTPSEVDVLDDGYKWRKYGQKVVNNTQHPRSYYRCTQDNCRVKKRVERLAEDPRMVLTTYEGRHVHSPSHDLEDTQSQSQLNNFFF